MHQRVLGGMGLLVLHSAHFSKIFNRLMGTTCSLAWRNSADTELVWTVAPAHPIARGVPQPIVIDEQEMYGEYFDIPAPDELIFLSTFTGGEVFRSGCCWRRGKGKVFYFSPGDQEYPVYHHPDIRRVLANAVQWAAARPGGRLRAAGRGQPSRRRVRRPAGRRGTPVTRRRALRAGVVGLGWAGQQHMAAYAELPGVDLVALAGLEADQLAELGDQYGDRRRSSGSPTGRTWSPTAELDVLSIATPTTLHAPDRGRRAGRRAARAVGEADGRERRRRASAMVEAARAQRPGARRVVQPPPPR